MKTIPFLLAGVLLLAACATPKYSYYFDHYDYNSGRKNTPVVAANETPALQTLPPLTGTSPIVLEKENVVASIKSAEVLPVKAPAPAVEKKELEKKYAAMTKAERREFRKALKTEVKNYIKAKKPGDHVAAAMDTKAMDYNLKMAIIFGAVALTLSFFGGVNSVFWIISVVSLVIGVVFFIKWIAEQ